MKYVFFTFPFVVLGFAAIWVLKTFAGFDHNALIVGHMVGAIQTMFLMSGIMVISYWSNKP